MEFKVYRPIKVEIPETGVGSAVRNIVSSGAKSISDVAQLGKLPDTLVKQGNQVYQQQLQQDLNKALLSGNSKKASEIESYLGQQKRTQPTGVISQGINNAHEAVNAATSNYLQPKTENEAIFQDYASMLPLYFLGGGARGVKDVASFFGKVAGGRYVGEQLEDYGLGKPGKIIGEIGVPAFFEIINLNNIKKHFDPIKNNIYNTLPEVAGETSVSASSISKALEDANKHAKGRLHQKEIYENLNDIKDLIHDDHIFLKDLQPLKVKLNTSIYKDRLDSLEPVLKQVNQTIKSVPSYGQAVHKADKIHQHFLKFDDHIDEAKNFISDTIKKVPVKSKWYIAKKGASLLIDNPVVNNSKIAFGLAKDFPVESGKYALEALKAASKKNSGALLSSLSKLGEMVEESENKPTTFKVYRPIK